MVRSSHNLSLFVTIDRFHVAKLLGGKVDKERKKIVKELKLKFKNDDDKLENIKGTMWLFRHHKKDLDEEGTNKLDKLFEISTFFKRML